MFGLVWFGLVLRVKPVQTALFQTLYIRWVSCDHNRGRPQTEWHVRVFIWMLGTRGAPTSEGDGIEMYTLYQGSEEEEVKQNKCYDEGGQTWA
jgi:hypothetical protein